MANNKRPYQESQSLLFDERKRSTLNDFQTKIGYEFKDENLLRQALTHSSFKSESIVAGFVEIFDNKRLEFLGRFFFLFFFFINLRKKFALK